MVLSKSLQTSASSSLQCSTLPSIYIIFKVSTYLWMNLKYFELNTNNAKNNDKALLHIFSIFVIFENF